LKILSTIPLTVVVILGGLTTSCATVAPSELVEARDSYQRAAMGQAQELDPAAVHEAKTSLDVAEAEFRRDAKGQLVKDRAYIADRMARLAEAKAGVILAEKNVNESRTAMGTIATKTNAELKSTKAELQQTRTDAYRTDADLKKAEVELAAAKTKGELSAADLAAKETEIALGRQALESERAARVAAEQRAKEALANLAATAQVKEEPRGVVITLSGAVLFASSKYVLLPAAMTALDNVADVLKANPDRNIVVEGHTDSQGTNDSNMELARNRAGAVREYLVSKGVAPEIITSVGLGSARSVADNKTAEGRANNRRVEIIVSAAERK
jgi:outer membrane protein OmpA-like peptidoglycan-associated protein